MNLGNQIVLLKAKIAERENTLKRVLKRGENHFMLLRNKLDPTADDITSLDIEGINAAHDGLTEEYQAAISIQREIAKLKKELGE